MIKKKTSTIIDSLSFMSDHNSDKNKKRMIQIKRNKERSKSSVELPKNDEKLKLVEKKQYAESIDHTPSSFLEHAININNNITEKANSNKEDTEVVISDLDGAVDENDDASSTPSIHISSSSGSGSFIAMKNTLHQKNQINHNQDNLTPSYLLLMQYFEQEGDNQNKSSQKIMSNQNLPHHNVFSKLTYRQITILLMIL